MNILQMEDLVKGMPDEMLMQEAQMPSGQIPQFLALSEVQRRKEMRDKFQAPPQATVADQILQSGIAAAMPQQPPQGGMGAPQGMPMGPEMGPPPGPQGAPVMAYGGGQMPYRMQGGGSVPPGGGNPQVFKQFMQRNFGTPQGLATNIGMVGGALLGGPLGSVAGANIGSYLGSRMSNPVQMSDWDRMRLFSTPFSQAAQQQAVPVEPPPFVDGMYSGGQVPGTVYMQQGQTVPGTNPAIRDLNARIANAILPRRSGTSVIREAQNLARQGKMDEAIVLLNQEGIDPKQAFSGTVPSAALTPPAVPAVSEAPASANAPVDFAASVAPQEDPFNILNVANRLNQDRFSSIMGGATAAPVAAPVAPPATDMTGSNVDITTLFPQARGVLGGRGSGMPQDLAAGMKPYEDILAIDPNAEVFKATDFTSLIEEQKKRGAERAASYEQTIKGIENEMKRERLGAVLTTLGANLMAGEGALGLEKAGALAQQIGKETRQEIAAERRAARTAEDATADRIFALNAQQLTGDKEAQRALFTAQRGVKEKALEFLQKDIGNRQQAEQAANQLAATLTVSMVNSIRDKVVSEGADRRSALSFAQSLAKEQLEILSANPQLNAMPKEELQNLINQTMRAALETAFSAVGTALPPTFNAGATSRGTAAPSGPREAPLSSFMGR
jgi:hypothetical protein